MNLKRLTVKRLDSNRFDESLSSREKPFCFHGGNKN